MALRCVESRTIDVVVDGGRRKAKEEEEDVREAEGPRAASRDCCGSSGLGRGKTQRAEGRALEMRIGDKSWTENGNKKRVSARQREEKKEACGRRRGFPRQAEKEMRRISGREDGALEKRQDAWAKTGG